MKLSYIVKRGADGNPTGPVYKSDGMRAIPVQSFATCEYIATRHGDVWVPPPADGSAQVTDAEGNTRAVWIADDIADFGVQ